MIDPLDVGAEAHAAGKINVPDQPIIPFIEGDGTGPDIWRASVRVFDAAIAKVYAGKRGRTDAFTTVDSSMITAQLNAGFSRERLARRAPAVAEEARSVILEPQADVPAGGRAQAAR